jgi:hypothetical protein
MSKKIIIILVIIIILTLAGGVFWYASNNQDPSRNQDQNVNISDEPFLEDGLPEFVIDERCAQIQNPDERALCEEDDLETWQVSVFVRATDEQNSSLCRLLLTLESQEECLLSYADTFPDASVCAQLTDQALKTDCENRMVYKKNDFSECYKLDIIETREYCFQRAVVHSENGGRDLCPTLLGNDQNKCWEIYYTQSALSRVDYDECRKIPTPEGIQRCLDVMPVDSDGDGLSDTRERNKYLTDPNNPDTDGDGYSDGEEVKNGFSPLSAG